MPSTLYLGTREGHTLLAYRMWSHHMQQPSQSVPILFDFESFFDWASDPDQSCVSCGATGILVVALQREVLHLQPILRTSDILVVCSLTLLCRIGSNQYLRPWTPPLLLRRYGLPRQSCTSSQAFRVSTRSDGSANSVLSV
jgi:hypothetical protein